MPIAPLKPCSHPGCGALTKGGACDRHRKQGERQRGSAAARGYGRDWQRIRERVLVRDAYLCQECKRGGRLTAVGKSGHVDHIMPKARGGTDDEANLQTLCPPCHSAKTAKKDGGFGN